MKKMKGAYFEGRWEEDLLPLRNKEIEVEYKKDKVFTTCPHHNKKVERRVRECPSFR